MNKDHIDEKRSQDKEKEFMEKKYKEIQDSYDEQIDELKKQIDDLTIEKQYDEKNIQNQEKIINDLESDLKQNEDSVKQLKKDLENSNTQIKELQTKLKRYGSAEESNQNLVSQYEEELEELRENNATLEKKERNNAKEISELKDILEKNSSDIQKFKADAKVSEGEQNKLKNQLLKIKKELNAKEDELSNTNDEVNKYKRQTAELKSVNKRLENEIEQIKKQSQNPVKNRKRTSSRISELGNVKTELEPIITSNVEEVPSDEILPEISTDIQDNTDPLDSLLIYDKNSKEYIPCNEIITQFDPSIQTLAFDNKSKSFQLFAHTDEDIQTESDECVVLSKEEYGENVFKEASKLLEPMLFRINFFKKIRKQLQNENDLLKGQEGKTEDEKIHELMDKINDLVGENTDLNDSVKRISNQCKELQENLSVTEKKLKNTQDDEKDVKLKFESLDREHKVCRKTINKLKTQLNLINTPRDSEATTPNTPKSPSRFSFSNNTIRKSVTLTLMTSDISSIANDNENNNNYIEDKRTSKKSIKNEKPKKETPTQEKQLGNSEVEQSNYNIIVNQNDTPITIDKTFLTNEDQRDEIVNGEENIDKEENDNNNDNIEINNKENNDNIEDNDNKENNDNVENNDEYSDNEEDEVKNVDAEELTSEEIEEISKGVAQSLQARINNFIKDINTQIYV